MSATFAQGDRGVSNGGMFEAVNYALRKSRDGVIVSFVIHPLDVSAALTALPIGARVAIRWAELTAEEPASGGQPVPPSTGCGAEPGRTAPPSRKLWPPFPERPLSQQAYLRCQDIKFWRWLNESGCKCESAEDAAKWVRSVCLVTSRATLDVNAAAAKEWRRIERDYSTWLTELEHGALVR